MGQRCRIVSWNIARRQEPWAELAKDEALDVALLQEASPPQTRPSNLAGTTPDQAESWRMAGYDEDLCAAVAWFRSRVRVEPLALQGAEGTEPGKLRSSRAGTFAAADLHLDAEVITVVSMYGAWEQRLRHDSGIFADASVHRVLSDLAPLVYGAKNDRPMIVAGDLNIYRGYGEPTRHDYWKARYDSVFSRFEAMGLPFVGPRRPDGRPADPRPELIPEGADNVPTYHTKQRGPGTAEHQLDFVFASRALHDRLKVRALNEPDEWGPSDHCRILIELDAQ